MNDLSTLGTGHKGSQRRRSAHSMERIEPNRQGAKGWLVFAGDLGHSLGYFRSKSEATDALDTWHYFHPEEQQERDRAWVHHFIQSMRGAMDEGVGDEWLSHLASRWGMA